MATGTQVWLTSGEVYLVLENGEEVLLTEGNYLSCEAESETAQSSEERCEILPLALAPAAPAGLVTSLGSAGGAAAAGGLAAAPLAATSATVIGSVIIPVIGVGVLAAGIAASVASTESTNSTNSTNGN
ncbi:MAG: hypothetical protein AAGD47_16325 [Pseudomonadota bacterium]